MMKEKMNEMMGELCELYGKYGKRILTADVEDLTPQKIIQDLVPTCYKAVKYCYAFCDQMDETNEKVKELQKQAAANNELLLQIKALVKANNK